MATYHENLISIRDSCADELAREMDRRAALVAAGHPPPTNYSIAGRSVSWDGYVSGMMARIKEVNELVIQTGAEGIPDLRVRAYT